MPNNIDMGGFGSPGLPVRSNLYGVLGQIKATSNASDGSSPVLDLSQTWSNSAVTFDMVRFNAVRTAYNANSRIFNLTIDAGTSVFSVSNTGAVTAFNGGAFGGAVSGTQFSATSGANVLGLVYSAGVNVQSGLAIGFSSSATNAGVAADAKFNRAAAGHIVQRNSTNSQQFSVANTDDAGANYEWATVQWSSNVAYLKTVAAGTGTRRLLIPVTNPTTVASLPAAATAGAGARSMVTDATVTTFASVVAGTGSNTVPVYSDGTDWRIG